MTRKEHQPVTRGIKNCRDIRLFKGCSPLQLSCNFIGNRPQSATFHTANVSGKCKKIRELGLQNPKEQLHYSNISDLSKPLIVFFRLNK
jgi:hypothetical protein